MANAILPKYSASAALTVTLASLANGSARQSTLVDNSTTRYQRIYLYPKIKLGTSPASNSTVNLFALRGDQAGTPIRTDGAGASDAAITVKNAQPIGSLFTGASAATGDVLADCYVIENPGREWGIAVANATSAALDATGGNHVVDWVGEYPEVQ